MTHLHSETKTSIDTYTYRATGYDHPGWGDVRIVITFENGAFRDAQFPFRGTYTRNQWRILGEIADKITELEGRYT